MGLWFAAYLLPLLSINHHAIGDELDTSIEVRCNRDEVVGLHCVGNAKAERKP
jgi:hypothetical protein